MASKYGNANRLLTRLSIDRRNAATGYVAEFVAPTLSTGGLTSGEYWVFDQGNNFQNPANEKASGGVSREIHFNASVSTFSTNAYGSRAGYTQKELDSFSQTGGDAAGLRRAKMNMVTDADMIAHEIRAATLVTTAGSYAAANKKTLSGTTQWSDLDDSDPFGDVMTAKDAIIAGDAVEANSMVVSHAIHSKLVQHPDIAARISDNEGTGFSDITARKIGNLFGLDYRVAAAQYRSSDEGQTFTSAYCWGDFALIFHRAPSPGKEQISLAYNFAYQDFQMRTYFDTPSKKTYVDNDHDCDLVLVGASVGYLLSDVLA
jgi:hypothetical protein